MLEAVNAQVAECDIFIGVAAVADYRVAKPQRAEDQEDATTRLTLELVPDRGYSRVSVAERPNPPFCVGFAAESQDLEQFAEEKRRRKKLPLLAANLAQEAIGAEDSELVLFDDAGRHPLPQGAEARRRRAC